MTTSELKLDIFRKLDLLEKKQLNVLSGVLTNLVHGQYAFNDWEKLSIDEQDGIKSAIIDLKKNGGVLQSEVIADIRNRIANA